MSLDLDTRQRAMLREMGVHVWLAQHQPALVQPGMDPVAVNQTGAAPVLPPVLAATPVPTSLPATEFFQPMVLTEEHWGALAHRVAQCQACTLCAARKHPTLSVEAPVQSDWFVLGDPPDEDEDRQARPFVEQPGVLLDNMLKAVGARRGGHGRQGAYVSNVVKCRPPSGRLPLAEEMAQCANHLHHEIAMVQPRLILAVGRFATQLLLQDYPEAAGLPLGKLRSVVYRYRGIPVVVSYHPKVLLRASSDKAKAWADLCLCQDVLEGKVGSLQ
jgi:DNA polymerase